ncbi:ABC transporter ATP-binding protein [Isoptericola variabilis]|uniref:Teichoic-acid-transporting ATPase n=1 Tax=Isoptericola variabilis (strain 225) TaxID=743718 RepID=F6FS27_ISOV2|nr:ABC transporter ATP-binding protein [Isoptericola variabilis]AEG45124.1 Teichoic-acid-transporting ATPase [Isoptericola variabilis 225]TWH32234.1 ABC-2 type transport system ATP-binding protein [Isoptericola variabilis J7]
MTTVVEIENLSKRFTIRKEKSLKERIVNFGRSQKHKEQFWALRGVDLSIRSGSTVGLIGPNGSGKSTLLKMIGGILQPDTGTVSIRGRLAALLELGAGFHPDLTGRENVYLNAAILGISREQTDRYFDAIVDFSGIEKFIDTQVKFYSSGMYVRLAFAVAVHVDPDILLVDEVLAVGDEPFQRKCLERIRQFQAEGRTIVLVTHGLDQVAEFCDRAVVLESGKVVVDGSPREALRTLRADFEEARLEERERHLAASTEVRTRSQFTGISLRSESGETGIPTLRPGEGLHVAMEVKTDGEPLEGCVLEIGVTTSLGSAVYTTSTELLGTPLPVLDGVQHFAFFLRSLHLGEDEYHVRASLRDAQGGELHHVPVAATFTVSGDGRSLGFLSTETDFVRL